MYYCKTSLFKRNAILTKQHPTKLVVAAVLHDLLITLKLCSHYLVPGDTDVMVDVLWMLLLGVVHPGACLHIDL